MPSSGLRLGTDMIFYSKANGGFYSTEVHGGNMPSDVVPVTAEQYQTLLIGQSQGKQITAGPSGPVLSDPPASNPVPQTVTRFQALAALHLANKLTAVQAIMAAPETPVLAKLAWDNALSFERNSPTLLMLAGAIGMTSQDLDALFTEAAGLSA